MTDIAALHPGEHLADILAEPGIGQPRLAAAIGASPQSIDEIVR